MWAVLSGVLAALTAIFTKIGVKGIDSHYATLIRSGIVFVFLLVVMLSFRRFQSLSSIAGKTWIFLTLSACATGGSLLCYFRALQLGTLSQVVPVDKLSLPLTAVLAFLILGDRPSIREWCGLALMVAGIALLIWRKA